MRLKRFLAFVVAFAMVMSVMPAMSLTASAEAVVQTATTCFSYRVNKKTMEDYGMLTNVRGGNQRDGYAVFEIPENLRNASNIDATFTVTRKTEVGGFNSKTVTVKYLLLDDEANTVATDNTSALDYLDGTKTYTDGATISINNNNVNASYTSNTFSFVPNGAKTIIVEIPYNRDTQNSGGEYYGAGVENAPYLTMVASTKVTADYKVGEKTIKTETKSYVDGEEGAVFDAYAYSENGSSVLYKSEQTTLSENGSIVMTAQKNADVLDGATIVTVDDVTYSVVSDNLIPNGDFSEGMTGWYRGNKNGAGLVATTSEFELMGDKTVKTKNNGGTGSGADLYRAWPVEEGKTYYFQVYFGDDRVDPRLSSGDDISVATNASDDSGFVIKHGFEKGLNTVVFTANTDYVWINVAWNQNVTVGNFGLYEVVEAVSITNLAELEAFRDDVNAGNTYAGKTVVLTNDIDLEGSETNLWTPIGTNADAVYFAGTFDGQGHTISNLYVKQGAAYHAAGLFGAVRGTVKNLTIDTAYVESLSSGSATVNGTAVVAGSTAYGATIDDVHVKDATVKGNRYVAGIVGYMDGTVTNCSVENVTIVATPDDLTGSYDNGDKVGGIVGYCNSGSVEITNCELKGNVDITAYRDVAGIVGCANSAVKVNNNTNNATLAITIDTTLLGERDNYNVGEFVGRNTPAETTGNVTTDTASYETNVVIVEANYVAEVDGEKYEDLQAAINEADGKTVTLLSDVELAAGVVVAADDVITLDLNGKTITYNSTTQGEAMITNKGTLTINDSSEPDTGVINYNYTGAADSSYSKGNYTISNAGTLTVNGGKITIANLKAHAKYPIDNNSTTGDAILVINGGHLYNYNTSAIRQFCNSTTNQNSVTIDGGLIEGYCAIWVQNPGSNTVNGSLSITGGEIKTTAAAYVDGSSELKDVASRIYCTIDGDGGAWSENSAVSITGGTINENVYLAAEAPESITIDEETATFNGYVELPAPTGTITLGYTSQTGVWGEGGSNSKESFVVELYVGEDKIAYASLNNINNIIDGELYVTWSIPFAGSTDEYWNVEWLEAPSKDRQPTTVKLVADGEYVAENTVVMNGPDNLNPVVWEELEIFKNYVAEVDGVKYETLADAIKSANANETVTIIADGTYNLPGFSKNITIEAAENVNATIDMVNKQVSIRADVTFNNLTFAYNAYADYKGIIDNGTITYNNCDFTGKMFLYGKKVAFNECTFTQNIVDYNVWTYAADEVVFTDCEFNCVGKCVLVYNDGDGPGNVTFEGCTMTASEPCSTKAAIEISSQYITGHHTVNIDSETTATGFATDTISGSSLWNDKYAGAESYVYVNSELVWPKNYVAEVDGEKYESLAEALEAAEDGDTVTLLTDISLDEMVTVTGTVTLDLNGYTITGTDNTTANFGLITVNKGNLTVTDSSEAKTGNINLTATNDNGWSRYSAVIANNQGTVTVEGGTIKHLGGTTMAYGIDNLTNGNIGVATLNVAGGVIDSSYIAIRQFGNSDTLENALNVTGGTLKGTNSSVYVQSPNAMANDISTTISDDATVEKRVFVETQGIIDGFTLDISATAVSEIVGNLPEGYEFVAADGKWGMVEVNYVAENTTTGVKYESLAEALNEAVKDDTVTLVDDIELSETVKVEGTVTLDLNGYIITGTDNATASFALIEVQPGAELTICDSSEAKTGAITLFATNNRGWNAYSSVVSNQRGKLTVEGGTIEHLGGTDMAYGIDNLTNGKGTYAETVINGGTVKSTYRAIRQFLNGTEADNILTVNGGTIEGANKSIWMQDPNTNANTGTLTVGEEATLKGDVYLFVTAGSTEWPVEVAIAAAALDGESEVLTGNVPEGYELVLTDGVYGVIEVPAPPTATVTEITDEELAEGNAPELTFALNFVADEASDEQIAYYSDWYADYVLTINKTATFNADGSADGYLAGQYDNYNTGWLAVPDADVTVNANEGFRIMKYAAEMLEQPGLNITYGDVIGFVNDFDCGIFFDDLFLIENPDLKVTLELRMYNPEDETEYYTIGEVYEFDAPEVEAPALPTATVTELENEDLTFALNFKADEASDEQLAYYGNWYADFELKVDGTVDETITFYTGEGADGYLSGEYGSYGWINVPFNKEVTVNKGETIKIMALAAEIMGEPGLKLTYNDVYTMVKDFNCGVFFENLFLIENPDAVVTLELRMYNPVDETESYVIGETYTFEDAVVEAPALPTATVTELDKEDLTFALNFKADDASDEQLAYYGNWYADFELKVDGTVDETITFYTGEGADGYLSGEYGTYGWINVPFNKEVTVNKGETIKIMALAAEIMGEPGLKLTYNDVYTMVKDFNCGVFFTDEFLRANPDAVVTLELRMYNPVDETESYVIGTTYTFDAPEVADPVAEFDGETFETLQEAIDAVVENGEGTVTLLANSEEDVVIADYVTVTLVTGDYSYTGEAQLASYGAWIVADEEINAVSTVSDVPVVKGEGNGQYGYVAMAHGVNMVNGAQVRFNSGVDEFGKVATTADKKQGSGIRFVTNVDRNDTLASMADSLDAEVTIDGETYTKGVIGVIISAEGSTSEMIISANSWQTEEIFTSAVTNLAVSNYIRRFTATGFVDVDGIRYRNNTNVTRSIYQVAAGLLKTGNAEVDSDGNHTYDPTDATLIQVLNAYVNQTGIRLVIVDNEHLVPNVATAETGINGAYNSEAYFEVVTSYTEGAKYIAVLDPVGENTEINMNYWNEYVRINNNNSATRGKVEMVKNSDGTYTLTFDAAGTKFEPTGDNEKNDSYDDNYDEAE